MLLTIDYIQRKQRKNVEDVIHDMLPIRNNVIHCIDFGINCSQMIFFFFLVLNVKFWSYHLLHGKRRVDKISLTIDYNKRKQKRVKNVIRDMLPIWNSAIQCIDFAIDPSQIIGFFFFLAECQILVMSSTTWHQRRVDNIFLTIDCNKRTQKSGEKCYVRQTTKRI